MEINDIVYLKSHQEKMMITWINETSEDDRQNQINKIIKMSPDYKDGNIAVKYGKKEKAMIPAACLIDDLSKRVKGKVEKMLVGNVVKHKLDDEEMTITWIIGENEEEGKILNLDKLYKINGFKDGDLVCGYFASKKYLTKLVKIGEVEKIYE